MSLYSVSLSCWLSFPTDLKKIVSVNFKIIFFLTNPLFYNQFLIWKHEKFMLDYYMTYLNKKLIILLVSTFFFLITLKNIASRYGCEYVNTDVLEERTRKECKKDNWILVLLSRNCINFVDWNVLFSSTTDSTYRILMMLIKCKRTINIWQFHVGKSNEY